tara:strand:+ start:303 stop:458 length:156 start_codon:yes stop_codon:yes gene_type:complete
LTVALLPEVRWRAVPVWEVYWVGPKEGLHLQEVHWVGLLLEALGMAASEVE